MFVCRDCGATVAYWPPGGGCPHCGSHHHNRLTEARVQLELDALAYLYGSAGEPSDTQVRSLMTRLQKEADAENQRQGNGEGTDPAQGKLFP